MNVTNQKRLAIAGALAALGVFIAANVHLVTAALRSQPSCVGIEGAPAPAKRAC